jgi:hypothetical protein
LIHFVLGQVNLNRTGRSFVWVDLRISWEEKDRLDNRESHLHNRAIRIIESDIPDNAKSIGDDAEFVDVTEMTINVELFDFRVGFCVSGH